MNRQRAIEIYLKERVHSEIVIGRIMKWNVNKNLVELAEIIGINYSQARALSRMYSLKHKALNHGK